MRPFSYKDTGQPERYKGFSNIEGEARRQIEAILDSCKASFTSLAPALQQAVIRQLRPLAQKTILNAMEGRVEQEEKHFGYEWGNALQGMSANAIRTAAARYLIDNMPEIEGALKDTAARQRTVLEWLYDQTAGRIRKFTPYLVREDQQLENWREQCPKAYRVALNIAERLSRGLQERTRPKTGGEPSLNDAAKRMATMANMVAARKFFLLATDVGEYFEERTGSIVIKVPLELQGLFASKVFIRFGLNPRPTDYRPATEVQMRTYEALLSGMNGNMLKNLQEGLCPWTAEQALNQKISANLLAEVYFNIVRPQDLSPPESQLDESVLQKLGGDVNRYKMLGFLENISKEQCAVLRRFIDGNAELREFLDKPSVQEAFRANRVDRTLVQTCLNAAVAHELVRSVKSWREQAVSTQDSRIVSQAKSTLPHILQDLALYHNALMQSDYITVQQADFYKEHLQRLYLPEISLKERSKIESYYKAIAVVLVAGDERYTGAVPAEWVAMGSYTDPGTGKPFTDYSVQVANGRIIICLAQGASPSTAVDAANNLLNLAKRPCIDKEHVQGVRISELSFNELRGSCLHPRSIARMQFYTSFSPAETLSILRGSTQEPTDENISEALRPCFILKYKDHGQSTNASENFYCRVKPAEMVRVKYRTPTGEVQNPCWDASQIIGGLSPAEMEKRFQDVSYRLIIIEGEKKAAMLAQVMQDMNLPYHVISIPGVWMGVVGPRKSRRLVAEIGRFDMRNTAGKPRNCLIFFDNDKAFNPAVMDALLQTAVVMQKEGADVYVPNLPFGKKIKGADDFALAHCRSDDGVDFQPLIDIIERATYIPANPSSVKYPGEEQKRKIAKCLEEAEQVQELQEVLRKSQKSWCEPALRKLFILQAPHILQISNERAAGDLFDSQSEGGKLLLMGLAMKDNPALTRLHEACAGIPAFDHGMTLKEKENSTGKAPLQETSLELFQAT